MSLFPALPYPLYPLPLLFFKATITSVLEYLSNWFGERDFTPELVRLHLLFIYAGEIMFTYVRCGCSFYTYICACAHTYKYSCVLHKKIQILSINKDFTPEDKSIYFPLEPGSAMVSLCKERESDTRV